MFILHLINYDNHEGIKNVGSIRVRNIKDLKIESAAKPNTRKRRISDKVEDSVESVGNISSDEECGGKRLKMRGRRSNVAKRFLNFIILNTLVTVTLS